MYKSLSGFHCIEGSLYSLNMYQVIALFVCLATFSTSYHYIKMADTPILSFIGFFFTATSHYMLPEQATAFPYTHYANSYQ